MKRWESQYQRFVVDLRALIRAELLEEDALTRFPGVAAWGMPFVQIRTIKSSPADANILGCLGFHDTALTHPEICPSTVFN